MKKLLLGDLLVENNIISSSQLEKALVEQKATGRKLGDILIDLEMVEELDLLNLLATQLDLPLLDLNSYKIKKEIVKLIPENIARRYKAIPIDRILDNYLVAMSDPTDLAAYDEMVRRLHCSLRIVVVRESQLVQVIDDVYRHTEEIASLVGKLEDEMRGDALLELGEENSDAPILKLLNSIFEDALQVNASDIHIEPDSDCLRIRLRVDGLLQEQVMKGKNIISALVLRLKLMAKLNISERRLPQDGRFTIIIKGKKIDVRISTMPVLHGESVAMRLLDQSDGMMHLNQLGMTPKILECYRSHLRRPHGMILVTGPTGSGKSTTLYAGLSEINSSEKKIITVEDPIEYSFERVNQVQVVPKIGLSFTTVLRSALRQDPDVLMVGEMRDEETAVIALRAAMTGHLVLSTLHTNDAISSPIRLLDMGADPFLTASALRLVIAQRLLRRICLNCNEFYSPTDRELILLSKLMQADVKSIRFMKGKGCKSCAMTGYKGRVGVYEILEVNTIMADALRRSDVNGFKDAARETPLYRSLSMWALDLAIKGTTSINEVFRLTGEVEDEN